MSIQTSQFRKLSLFEKTNENCCDWRLTQTRTAGAGCSRRDSPAQVPCCRYTCTHGCPSRASYRMRSKPYLKSSCVSMHTDCHAQYMTQMADLSTSDLVTFLPSCTKCMLSCSISAIYGTVCIVVQKVDSYHVTSSETVISTHANLGRYLDCLTITKLAQLTFVRLSLQRADFTFYLPNELSLYLAPAQKLLPYP
jgi:hypothetical protein